MKHRVFLSHAHADKQLAKHVTDWLLKLGLGLGSTAIFCSSRPGLGVDPGANFRVQLRDELAQAGCAIALLTPNYFASPYCMCELGAIWVLDVPFFPLLVPPLGETDLGGVANGLLVLHIGEQKQLDVLHQNVPQALSADLVATPLWNDAKEDFLAGLAPNPCGVAEAVERAPHGA